MRAGARVIAFALAAFGSVAVVAGAGLKAWRWWLDAWLAVREKQVQDLEAHLARFQAFERRLTAVEVNSKGFGQR